MTSENELKDAAYRVNRCEAGETLLVVYDAESWPLAKIAYRDDCERLAIAYLDSLAADEQRERDRLLWAPQFRAEWMERIGQSECDRPIVSIEDEAKMLLSALLNQELLIAQQAKEDAEPITEEWLASIGFTNQTMNGWSKLFDGDGSICELFVSHEGDVSICQDSDHVTLSMMPRITTRGQLRKLLEALKGGAS